MNDLERKAHDLGYEAYFDGAKKFNNPYDPEYQEPRHEAWEMG